VSKRRKCSKKETNRFCAYLQAPAEVATWFLCFPNVAGCTTQFGNGERGFRGLAPDFNNQQYHLARLFQNRGPCTKVQNAKGTKQPPLNNPAPPGKQNNPDKPVPSSAEEMLENWAIFVR
jgi:hypothetical protein